MEDKKIQNEKQKEVKLAENKVIEGEKVTVDKAKLDKLLARLDRLEAAASVKDLNRYDNQHKGELGKVVKLLMLEGKVITSWGSMLKNMCQKDEVGKWVEEQTVELVFEDGTKRKMPYVFFARQYQPLLATVVSETKNLKPEIVEAIGDITFKVETNDGKEYEIGSNFIN